MSALGQLLLLLCAAPEFNVEKRNRKERIGGDKRFRLSSKVAFVGKCLAAPAYLGQKGRRCL